MKHLRQIFVTIVLVCTLTGVAAADDGVMHPWQASTTPGNTQPDEPVTLEDVAPDVALALAREIISLY